MSEQVHRTDQQTLAIGLGVIAVLLAVIVGLVVYFQGQRTAIPEPAGQAQSAPVPAGQQAPAGMGQQAAATFDPKTATKVPTGVEPEEFVKGYYEACEKGDWTAAFNALPAAKKAGNSPEALKAQVTGYGIKSYKITSAKVEGDKATVTVDQVTGQYGTFENTWTFVKKDGVWLVESKAVTGMK